MNKNNNNQNAIRLWIVKSVETVVGRICIEWNDAASSGHSTLFLILIILAVRDKHIHAKLSLN